MYVNKTYLSKLKYTYIHVNIYVPMYTAMCAFVSSLLQITRSQQ